jgi:hypothetical protein
MTKTPRDKSKIGIGRLKYQRQTTKSRGKGIPGAAGLVKDVIYSPDYVI